MHWAASSAASSSIGAGMTAQANGFVAMGASCALGASVGTATATATASTAEEDGAQASTDEDIEVELTTGGCISARGDGLLVLVLALVLVLWCERSCVSRGMPLGELPVRGRRGRREGGPLRSADATEPAPADDAETLGVEAEAQAQAPAEAPAEAGVERPLGARDILLLFCGLL
jgi:hypothetical protein